MNLKAILPLFLILFSVSFVSAQTSSNNSTLTTSSYSIYGLGEEIQNNTSENIGKGGLSNAVVSDFSPSFNNAATFYHNKLSTFQAGVKFSEKEQIANNIKNWSNNAGLNYVQLSFPINKWWGSGVGMLPVYSQGYNLLKDSVQNNFGLAKYSSRGEGTLTSLVWSNGINPFKWISDTIAENFSLGFGVSYLFGNTSNYDAIQYTDSKTLGYYDQIISSNNVYNGLNFNAGFIHKFRLTKKMELALGASYIFNSQLKNDFIREIKYGSFVTYDAKERQITLPTKYAFGTTLIIKNNLQIGLEYKKAKWSKFNNGLMFGSLKDATTYIVGLEYNPHKANENIFKNISYRVGCRYVQSPYIIAGNIIDERAVSIGFGLPIKKSFSTLNIGLEAMQRGRNKDGLVLENYYSAYLGITINDRWFIKQKYD